MPKRIELPLELPSGIDLTALTCERGQHELVKAMPFYARVPKDPVQNLRFRKMIRNFGHKSAANAALVREWCRRDILFYINTFIYTFDPRMPGSRIPFLTFPFQDNGIARLMNVLGKKSACIRKSRDTGASWMIVLIFDHQARFEYMRSFLMVSRNESCVDSSANTKSLFWKLDFIESNLPSFLRSSGSRIQMHKSYDRTGSVIDGETTTASIAMGDRRTAIMPDEFADFDYSVGFEALASMGFATNCILYNSTPKGADDAYALQCENVNLEQLSFHWSQRPDYAAGLYHVDCNGKVTVIDKKWHEKNPDYAFVPEESKYFGLRSPFYDYKCREISVPMLIAREYDLDFTASGSPYFDQALLNRIKSEDVREPYLKLKINIDTVTQEFNGFSESPNGELWLWAHPDAMDEFAHDRNFVIGIDISAGTGASNSCLVVVDKKTGEKVGELATPFIRPDKFAEITLILCRMFRGSGEGAFLVWEANAGPGRNFGDRVAEMGYGNVYFRKRAETSISEKSTNIPGWWNQGGNKEALLASYHVAMSRGKYTERSAETVKECLQYRYQKGGVPEHIKSISNVDPSGARDNHGDRVIASALANMALGEVAGEKDPVIYVPPMSIQGRRDTREKAEKNKQWW